jgi:hypothetical protein
MTATLCASVRIRDRLHLFFLRELAVSHEALEAADADRFAAFGEDAVLLALVLLRAHAAADGRQGIRLLDLRNRAVEVTRLDLLDEGGNIHGNRAALAALRHLAVQAALRLGHGRVLIIAESYLVEIMRADRRVLCRHRMLLQ